MKYLRNAFTLLALASCGALAVAFAQSPAARSASPPAISVGEWSRPAIQSTYGVQTRWMVLPSRVSSTAGTADGPEALCLFEPIPAQTIEALQARFGPDGLAYSPTLATRASVRLKAPYSGEPARTFEGVAVGPGKLVVRVPAPEGGWLGQPLELEVRAWSHDTLIYSTETGIVLQP